MAEPAPKLAAALAAAELAADLREWLAWADDTGALDVPVYERPAAVAPSQPLRAAPPLPAPPLRAAPPALGAALAPRVAPAPQLPPPAPPDRGAPPPRPTRAAPARITTVGGESLAQIRADLGACDRCPLHARRRHIVFGVGNPEAELMLIGEAPGQQEDLTGEPFVGRSGQLLTRMLAAIGLERTDVYIANVVKCRPPDNRDPDPAEIARCVPYLHRQIASVRPRVLLTLGRFAAHAIVGLEGSLGELRRQLRSYQQLPVVATYHPSYLLRTPRAKRQAWEDLLRVRALLRGE